MNETINKIIKERQAVKAYSDKKISKEDWDQITDMIQWAPSSHGWEPYRVLTVKKDSPLRVELQKAMWGQGQPISADKLSFFISLDRATFASRDWAIQNSLRKMEGVMGLKGQEAMDKAIKQADALLAGSINMDETDGDQWAMKQAYIGLMAGMVGATLLGIGSTPMEGLDKRSVHAILKAHGLIKDNERLAVACAFGYPTSETAYAHYGSGNRIRRPKSEKFTEV